MTGQLAARRAFDRLEEGLEGADVVMVFDECTPYPATLDEARASMELSLRWASRSHASGASAASPSMATHT